MPTASNSPAKACAGHEANRTRRLDQPPLPVTQIHRPARLATRAASSRYGGRHHSGIPGDIIQLCPGDFVGIRILVPHVFVGDPWFRFWGGMFGVPADHRPAFYSALGKDKDAVFPIRFDADPRLATGAATGQIMGFYQLSPEVQVE